MTIFLIKCEDELRSSLQEVTMWQLLLVQ